MIDLDRRLDGGLGQPRKQARGWGRSRLSSVGDPYHELLRVVEEIRADAVVGASAKAGHSWVGSLAVRLVRSAAGRSPLCREVDDGRDHRDRGRDRPSTVIV